MNGCQVSISSLAAELRAIIQSGPGVPESAVEKYLDDKFRVFAADDKLDLLDLLIEQFKDFSDKRKPPQSIEQKELSRLFPLLLGKKTNLSNLSSDEILVKLSQSLKTVFSMINQIISVIQTSLLGQKAEVESISLIIGSQVDGDAGTILLQRYLDQIQKAFLIAYKASQQAAHNTIQQVLSELDPEKLETATNRDWKFGPLRKAEHFDLMRDKFLACKNWFDSGRADEEFLRDFESVCQKLYRNDNRRVP
jgi:hypothetical protein